MAKKIRLKILDERVHAYGIPKPATVGAAAVDLRVLLDAPLALSPGDRHLLHTGLAVHIEDKNYAALVLPRSGLGHKHGIMLGNTIGLIDSDYQGELMISCYHRGTKPYVIQPGERLAQLMLVPVAQIDFEVVTEFAPSTRGQGGYGHTGRA